LLGAFEISPMGKQPLIVLDYAWPNTRRRRLPRWFWGLVITAGCLGLALVICFGYLAANGYLLGTTTESLTQQQTEAIGYFKLPPGTRNLRSHYEGFQDFYLHVRFSIPPDQASTFLQSTRISQPLSKQDTSGVVTGSGPSWWIKALPASFEAGGSSNPTTQPFIWQSILIDETNPQEYVVWFVAHDM
jgi:hypothetical protein